MKTLGQILQKFNQDAKSFVSRDQVMSDANKILEEAEKTNFMGQQKSFQAFILGAIYGYEKGRYEEFLNNVTDDEPDL